MSDTDRRTPWSWFDQAYPYALDALDARERHDIEERLAAEGTVVAAEFHANVRRIQETLAALTAMDVVTPPAQLEAAILQALDQRGAQPLRTNSVAGRGRARWLAAAAAAVVLAGAAVGITVTVDRANDGPGAVTAQQVLEQPDSRTGSAAVTGGGEMVVHLSKELGAAAVEFHDLPVLPADRAYQLWRVPPGGQPESVAVLAGQPMIVTPVRSADVLAVTVEPTGGSPAPTLPVLTGMTVD
ncbi:anti-sigma factor [Nocardia caishijiensis]|uniref:Regulator of SigK n=1 Tax=Nocardia caishijiensis TaxID=184756 RepID=A0ABQ6YS87_9NOCA|nr:anti-sigma factor [Nocardia caishijiensis]KAF0848654.1 anti-sigma-K factor RskA [Nocardia caishijiensis]